MPWFLIKFRRYETTPEGKKGREKEPWEETVEAPDVALAIALAEEMAGTAAGEDEDVHFDLETYVGRKGSAERAHAR